MLKRFSVGTSHIAYGGNRLGVFYCEKGALHGLPKLSMIENIQLFRKRNQQTFNWDNIFQGADWFHFTGISHQLSGEHLPQVVEEACQKAHAAGITISCDLITALHFGLKKKLNPL
jgi:2-dehydro-3-deoxygluconokinase